MNQATWRVNDKIMGKKFKEEAWVCFYAAMQIKGYGLIEKKSVLAFSKELYSSKR